MDLELRTFKDQLGIQEGAHLFDDVIYPLAIKNLLQSDSRLNPKIPDLDNRRIYLLCHPFCFIDEFDDNSSTRLLTANWIGEVQEYMKALLRIFQDKERLKETCMFVCYDDLRGFSLRSRFLLERGLIDYILFSSENSGVPFLENKGAFSTGKGLLQEQEYLNNGGDTSIKTELSFLQNRSVHSGGAYRERCLRSMRRRVDEQNPEEHLHFDSLELSPPRREL